MTARRFFLARARLGYEEDAKQISVQIVSLWYIDVDNAI